MATARPEFVRERYGAYELRAVPYADGTVRRIPDCVAATPSLEGYGPMLERLAIDRDEYHAEHGGVNLVPVLALFDRVERRWITSLWYPKTEEES